MEGQPVRAQTSYFWGENTLRSIAGGLVGQELGGPWSEGLSAVVRGELSQEGWAIVAGLGIDHTKSYTTGKINGGMMELVADSGETISVPIAEAEKVMIINGGY